MAKKPDTIGCVMLRSQGGGGSGYEEATVLHTDDIYKLAPTPITQKLGFPLILRQTGNSISASKDNPHAAWLMIDPSTGLAPMEWQSGVGDVLVVRADGEPLDIGTLAAVTDYLSDIVDAFSDGMDGAEIARVFYQGGKLGKYVKEHERMQEECKNMVEEFE
ncbi:MAG: hypothetical protein Q9209_003312 [Squamulea sp. 1 TL-2023]